MPKNQRREATAVRMRSREEITRVAVATNDHSVKALLFWVLGGDPPEVVNRAEAIPYRLTVDGARAVSER